MFLFSQITINNYENRVSIDSPQQNTYREVRGAPQDRYFHYIQLINKSQLKI